MYAAVKKAVESGELERRGSHTRLAQSLGISRVRVGQLVKQVIEEADDSAPAS